MAIKIPFARQAGLRAYGYVYTMLGTKDSNAQHFVAGEDESVEQPDRRQKVNFWTRQRQALLLGANFSAPAVGWLLIHS